MTHDEIEALEKRLRSQAYWMIGYEFGREGENDAPSKAADAIAHLRAEVERLTREKKEIIASSASAINEADARAESAERHVATLREALREIEWSNNCEWQRRRAQTALAKEVPK